MSEGSCSHRRLLIVLCLEREEGNGIQSMELVEVSFKFIEGAVLNMINLFFDYLPCFILITCYGKLPRLATVQQRGKLNSP